MNRARLKSYAPKARLDFLRAVTDRARKIGLSANHQERVTVQGDYAIIAGQAFPRVVAEQRRRLDERIAQQGFHAVMDEVAYTWFNRFMAIRYMELHGYLDHGFRVLSHPESHDRVEILEQAEHVALLGLDRDRVITLKLDGTQDEALYKLLLLAQCHALHTAMPFLFERIDDQTELLLPDNLLAPDSVIRKMAREIGEEDWEQIEVIGWLYQFYISDRKDEVIGKVVKSEDIPAATQLFTPNWIVKYMVQNSLGRQWLATYPHSALQSKMEYYIAPAEQTDEVHAQLDAITPTELDPEALTLIDPACGSGHILCEAYDLFKEIYLERGYRLRDIPRLILTKNVYGLDIDDRAAQMAGFALLMKARADDRRILETAPNLNVLALQSSAGLDAREIANALLAEEVYELVPSGELFPETRRQPPLMAQTLSTVRHEDIQSLLDLFIHAKTFGSLITVPPALASQLPALNALLNDNRNSPDLLKQQAVTDLTPLILQAELLAPPYDYVVANPPYMGAKYYTPTLKSFVGKSFQNGKGDLYGCFIQRCLMFAKSGGLCGMISIQNWMFLSTFENLRTEILETSHIVSLLHNGRGIFGSDHGTCTFIIRNLTCPSYNAIYKKLFDLQGSVATPEELRTRFFNANIFKCSTLELVNISGKPIAYWASNKVRSIFKSYPSLGSLANPKQGLATGNNDLYLRFWWEISQKNVGLRCSDWQAALATGRKWFPCNKGGDYRKWYGNQEFVLDWYGNGAAIKSELGSCIRNERYYYCHGLTWSTVTIADFSMRISPMGFIFESKGSVLFSQDEANESYLLGYLNSNLVSHFLKMISPSVDFHEGPLARIPVGFVEQATISQLAEQAVVISQEDWDAKERSWEFSTQRLLQQDVRTQTVMKSLEIANLRASESLERLHEIEECINKILIEGFGLQDELDYRVAYDKLRLDRVDRGVEIVALLSYAVGCLMGRYSLDAPGLIYAHSSNQGFDANRYHTFPADDDGILPITDTDWFDTEDTANRFAAFLRTAWPPETLADNLKFVADSLGPKADETALETIRRYFCTGFYTNHLQTYKRRPIYWLFSSGKERAFQALVYLHRYQEGTLSRMRMEYVVPLQSRIAARIDQLGDDAAASVTTADRRKREKEREKLRRQLEELRVFDEKLRHYADRRIRLDLDDGVKVNYGKFGDLLADVKAVTGGE